MNGRSKGILCVVGVDYRRFVEYESTIKMTRAVEMVQVPNMGRGGQFPSCGGELFGTTSVVCVMVLQDDSLVYLY